MRAECHVAPAPQHPTSPTAHTIVSLSKPFPRVSSLAQTFEEACLDMSRHSPPLAAQRVAQALDKVASYALAIVAQEPLPQSAVAVALQQRLRLCILGCLHVDQSTAHPSRPAASDSLATTRRQQASSQQPTRVGKGKADASVSRQAPEARATRPRGSLPSQCQFAQVGCGCQVGRRRGAEELQEQLAVQAGLLEPGHGSRAPRDAVYRSQRLRIQTRRCKASVALKAWRFYRTRYPEHSMQKHTNG